MFLFVVFCKPLITNGYGIVFGRQGPEVHQIEKRFRTRSAPEHSEGEERSDESTEHGAAVRQTHDESAGSRFGRTSVASSPEGTRAGCAWSTAPTGPSGVAASQILSPRPDIFSTLCGVNFCSLPSSLTDYFELHTFPILQEPCYREQVVGCRIAGWPKHALQT